MADYTLSAKITGDSSGFEKAMSTAQKTVDNLEKKMPQSFKSASQQVGKSLAEIAAESGKTVNQLRSDVMKSAAAYQQAGMTKSEAMKQAYADIGYAADNSAQKQESAFNRVLAKIDSVSGKLQSIGGKMQAVGSAMMIGITTPITLAGKSMVNAASDFDENLNKVNVAFGDSADAVTEWADNATKQFGLSKNQALEATSLFGDMATSMGLTQPAAADMSTSLAGLAGDLASFKNISIDQAMTALAGVFTGETESLKQLGIVMTETNLEEFAAQTGQVYNEMSQAEKVQLRYNYVMAMAANAQGDYARTSDGTANSLRTFQGAVDNLNIALGQHLLPILTPLVQKATEMVDAFANADPRLQQLALKIAAIAAAAGPVLVILGTMTGSVGKLMSVFSLLGGKIAAVGGMKAALSGVFTAITGPVGIAVAAITALVAAFAYLMTTNDDFRSSVMDTVGVIGKSLQSVLSALLPVLENIAAVIGQTIADTLQTLAPIIAQIVTFIGQVISQLAPLIAQLIGQLAPIIQTIIGAVSEIISTILPPLTTVLQAIMEAINALMPPIMSVLTTVIEVVSSIITTISPIISFVAGVIGDIISAISPIISFIADVVSNIVSAITPIASTVSDVFSNIFSTVSSVMGNVQSFISGVFTGIQSAWNGLTGFVSGVFDGISSAVQSLVSSVTGFINGVIGGINSAIGLINKIPGVEIGEIPYLAHGTDNWSGGFAYMNESGRGELTYLPNGSQVIPHDISVKYAKESARANVASTEPFDVTALGEYIVSAMAEYGNRQGQALEKGISNMGVYFERRPFGRVIADMGFARG
ncbi:MAG TPA: phage tail tape measure protein [Candidatus Mediterraneibacter caccavium]|uniref:Phage tail tape measure protein n=1 Tax=Candidatus Mediterraneibacter caccavium TaxID=2838661 RepID=A0A9D1VY77_9FIRM|nr:phage tail tape measure protein [Candidatus Mediterraneibacter caccavium]